MESGQDNKPKRNRARRADVVGSFYTEPEQPDWKPSTRAWDGIEDEATLDIPGETRAAIQEAMLDYFYARDRELQAIVAAEAITYAALVTSAAERLVSLLSSKTDSSAIVSTRDALSEMLLDPLNPAFDPLARRDESGKIDFDAVEADVELANPLADAVREMGRALGVLDYTARRIAKEAKLLRHPDSIKPAPPAATAWATMVRKIMCALDDVGISTGVKKDTRKGASNLTLLMLALTRRWPKRYQQFNIGRDGQESEQAMAAAINEAKKSGGGA